MDDNGLQKRAPDTNMADDFVFLQAHFKENGLKLVFAKSYIIHCCYTD